jgi:hypothetical protein
VIISENEDTATHFPEDEAAISIGGGGAIAALPWLTAVVP